MPLYNPTSSSVGSGSVATDTIWDTKGDLAVGTGADTSSKLVAGTTGKFLAADSSTGTGLKWRTTAPFVLDYDTTGAADAGVVLQAAVDAGHRMIVIPAGTFKAATPVFDDIQQANQTLYILAHGVTFTATSALPTVAEWDTYQTSKSRPTGTKWFLFSSTLRAALSGGVVTCTGNNVTGTSTPGGSRIPVSPHLVVEGGAWDCQALTKYNGGFAFGNFGGAIELRSMHMSSGRALMSWWNYVDGNKMTNCSGWGQAVMDSTYDAALFYQITSGDGVYVQGTKTDNYMLSVSMTSCNGGTINSVVGGGGRLEICHAITVNSNHTELAANIGTVPRNGWEIIDSQVTFNTSFDYAPESQATNGILYLNDSGGEGKHTNLQIFNWNARHWMSGSQTDPGPGYSFYINNMNDRTRITVNNSFAQTSPNGSFSTTYGLTGVQIGGNAANEPTLAAALVNGRDHIGSGTFQIIKTQTSTMAAGQNVAMNIVVTAPGSLAGKYVGRSHVTPTFYDDESSSFTTSPHTLDGTLTASSSYAYAAAVCNTLPDGTIQYGAVTAEWLKTSSPSGVEAFEMYMPTGAYGATLVIWRKTGTGVLSAPDHYVALPVGTASGRFIDTGANINQFPWSTSSVPVPNTVAATNTTVDATYLNGNRTDLAQQNSQTGTTYTLALSDTSKVVELSNASAITLTVPTNATVGFPVGTTIELAQTGAGQVTIAAAGGVTLRSPSGNLKLAAQYAAASLRKRATDEWMVEGQLSA